MAAPLGCNPCGSLAQLDRQLPLRLRHFAPQLLQICLHRLVTGILAQRQGKPAIRGGKIVRRTQSCRVQGAHLDHGFGICAFRRRLQQTHPAVAVLGHAASIKIFLRLAYWIGGPRCRRWLGYGCGFWRFARSRGRSCSGSGVCVWRRSGGRRICSRLRRGYHRTGRVASGIVGRIADIVRGGCYRGRGTRSRARGRRSIAGRRSHICWRWLSSRGRRLPGIRLSCGWRRGCSGDRVRRFRRAGGRAVSRLHSGRGFGCEGAQPSESLPLPSQVSQAYRQGQCDQDQKELSPASPGFLIVIFEQIVEIARARSRIRINAQACPLSGRGGVQSQKRWPADDGTVFRCRRGESRRSGRLRTRDRFRDRRDRRSGRCRRLHCSALID